MPLKIFQKALIDFSDFCEDAYFLSRRSDFMRSIFKSFGIIAFLPYPKILCFPLFLRPVRDRAFACF